MSTGAVFDLHLDHDLRVAAAKIQQHRRQPFRAGALGGGNGNLPAKGTGLDLDGAADRQHFPLDAPRAVEDACPGVGQLHAPAGAHEQGRVKARLHGSQAPSHRRLRQVQLLRRRDQAAAVDNGQKEADVRPVPQWIVFVHRVSSRSAARRPVACPSRETAL
ncbi:MAG: hypothetical protein U5K56_20235 [Halioglobus sp.]|nr:hypothetical protein [Halioglobus sp.]